MTSSPLTAPAGFRAAGVTAGLKTSGRPDVALVVNDGPLAVAAALTTRNRVRAAAVDLTRRHVADGTARAVLLNSGCANACTGAAGRADAEAAVSYTADLLGVAPTDILLGQTGIIGHRVNQQLFHNGIAAAVAALATDGGTAAAQAICTTDTVSKETFVKTGEGWSVGGIAKGAGMLAPALATMLVVLTTDAVCTPGELDTALRQATAVTFDCLDSDGCMSTNDTVFVLASGASGVRATPAQLGEALTSACRALARQLLSDAEGANHDIAITVRGATSQEAALAVGRAVARSNLVKTAIFGNDPNWGRIVAQVGTVPADVAPFDPAELAVTINGVPVCAAGQATATTQVDMRARGVVIEIDLGAGAAQATIWTNDLTPVYVHENSAYTT